MRGGWGAHQLALGLHDKAGARLAAVWHADLNALEEHALDHAALRRRRGVARQHLHDRPTSPPLMAAEMMQALPADLTAPLMGPLK